MRALFDLGGVDNNVAKLKEVDGLDFGPQSSRSHQAMVSYINVFPASIIGDGKRAAA
jgi:hypothetical protein